MHSATPVHSSDELKYLAERFPDNILLKTACLEGDIAAAILLFSFDGVVHTQYMAANDIGRQLGALDLLLEETIQEYQHKEFKYFSFGISTEDFGKTMNLGLINQKESFGGRGLALDVYEVDIHD
jgi:lipid II:glycine glycyltransferase (peptidoglycan interpeptide bridge formation enzyme)